MTDTILVVDDNEQTVEAIKIILTGAGYEVQTAFGGAEAINLLEESKKEGKKIDLVLLDMMMPGMDGRATLREMRQKGFDEPVLVLSAVKISPPEFEGLQSHYGIVGYVFKPISKGELIERVDSSIH